MESQGCFSSQMAKETLETMPRRRQCAEPPYCRCLSSLTRFKHYSTCQRSFLKIRTSLVFFWRLAYIINQFALASPLKLFNILPYADLCAVRSFFHYFYRT